MSILRQFSHSSENTNSKSKLCGKIKKFDINLYDKYDVPARESIKKQLGGNVMDNPDIYAQDMILKIENCKYKYLELQVCCNWINEYPYEEPYIYERKYHFSKDTLFLIFNKKMTKVLMFDKNSINSTPHRIKKYSKTFVYNIPWRHILQFNIEDLSTESIMIY